jgi:hypothetical protein
LSGRAESLALAPGKLFVQFIALEGIASVPAMRDVLAFNGDNPLRLLYGNTRDTADAGFTAAPFFPDEEKPSHGCADR